MEERKNKGLVIAVIVLAILVLGLGGFIVYDKCLNGDKKDNNTTQSTTTSSDISVGLGTKEGIFSKLLINGKEIDMNVTGVEKLAVIDGVVFVKAWVLDTFEVFAYDKDANEVAYFHGGGDVFSPDRNILYLSNYVIEDVTVNGNVLTFTSRIASQDINYTVCNMDDINNLVRIKQSYKYENGKFSQREDVAHMTAKDYIEANKIDCSIYN